MLVPRRPAEDRILYYLNTLKYYFTQAGYKANDVPLKIPEVPFASADGFVQALAFQHESMQNVLVVVGARVDRIRGEPVIYLVVYPFL